MIDNFVSAPGFRVFPFLNLSVFMCFYVITVMRSHLCILELLPNINNVPKKVKHFKEGAIKKVLVSKE